MEIGINILKFIATIDKLKLLFEECFSDSGTYHDSARAKLDGRAENITETTMLR